LNDKGISHRSKTQGKILGYSLIHEVLIIAVTCDSAPLQDILNLRVPQDDTADPFHLPDIVVQITAQVEAQVAGIHFRLSTDKINRPGIEKYSPQAYA
jgi:hypothetical protein